MFYQENSSPKVLSETLKRIKTGRTLIYHSGVKTLFPFYKDCVICRVVIRSEYALILKVFFFRRSGSNSHISYALLLRNCDLIFSLLLQKQVA